MIIYNKGSNENFKYIFLLEITCYVAKASSDDVKPELAFQLCCTWYLGLFCCQKVRSDPNIGIFQYKKNYLTKRWHTVIYSLVWQVQS